jgi:hypothetical protein
LCAGKQLFTPGSFLVLISVIGWVVHKAIVRQEGLRKFENPVTSSGMEPACFWFVAQCFNQLLYRVSPS